MNVMKRKVDLFGNTSLPFEQQRKLQRQINSTTVTTGEMSSSSSIALPSNTLSTLRSLSILPPSTPSDVPRVVKNLRKARLEEIAEIRQNLRGAIGGAEQGDDAGKPKSEELQKLS